MIKALVYVSLKPSVLDPQGKTITQALHSLGYDNVAGIRVAKEFEMDFNSDDIATVEEQLKVICDKVLANPNTETWRYELVDK